MTRNHCRWSGALPVLRTTRPRREQHAVMTGLVPFHRLNFIRVPRKIHSLLINSKPPYKYYARNKRMSVEPLRKSHVTSRFLCKNKPYNFVNHYKMNGIHPIDCSTWTTMMITQMGTIPLLHHHHRHRRRPVARVRHRNPNDIYRLLTCHPTNVP